MRKSLALLPFLMLLAGGCASAPRPAVISLQPSTNGRGFAQSFPHVYFSQADDGDREIVLINDGIRPLATPQGGALQPLTTPPLQQVMHFKILWNPLHGTHSDAPSTTNAIIDWTIRSAQSGMSADSLHYQGAGFVLIDGDNQRLKISIRNATLQPTGHTGAMVDPLGPCTLAGSFRAYRNDDQVRAILADLSTDPGAAAEASASMDPTSNGPPPRSPAP